MAIFYTIVQYDKTFSNIPAKGIQLQMCTDKRRQIIMIVCLLL